MNIEIRDPQIDVDKIRQQIAARVAAHPAGLDPTKMGPATLHVSAQAKDDGAGVSSPDLLEPITDLIMSHRLKEPEFTSDAPVVGGLIVAIRRLWNWMSTKWYVRPILQQQSLINSKTALLLMQMAEDQTQKNAEIAALHKRVIQLESRLQEQSE